MNKEITIIIACYNAEKTIARTLLSLINQNNNKIEIIVVDDASTDDSILIVKELQKQYTYIKLIELEENSGPGIARNIALNEATGRYITILDSDDELKLGAIDLLCEKTTATNYDIYKFNHIYHNDDKDTFWYPENSRYSAGVYKDEKCEKFSTDNFYTWARIYKTDFLRENNIKYSEGIYYEDIIFALKAYTQSKTIEYIDEVLLICHVVEESATRSKYDSLFHIDSFEQAMQETFENIKFKDELVAYEVWNIFAAKAVDYAANRCPKGDENQSLERLLKVLMEHVTPSLYGPINLSEQIRLGVFKSNEEILKIGREGYQTPNLLSKFRRRIMYSKSVLRVLSKIYKNPTKFAYVNFFDNKRPKRIILFQGFDYRYTGNSRYLFEKIIKENKDDAIFFVTTDESVTKNYRIKPYSLEHFYLLAKARIIYLESYGEANFSCGENAECVQLWHGIALKKLLMDSVETINVSNYLSYKTEKLKKIKRWNKFLVPSDFYYKKAQSSFLLPKEKLLLNQYPRVQWILDNNTDSQKEIFKKLYNIPTDKKIIFYCPTWRDYWGTEYDDGRNAMLSASFFDNIYKRAVEITITNSNTVKKVEINNNSLLYKLKTHKTHFLLTLFSVGKYEVVIYYKNGTILRENVYVTAEELNNNITDVNVISKITPNGRMLTLSFCESAKQIVAKMPEELILLDGKENKTENEAVEYNVLANKVGDYQFEIEYLNNQLDIISLKFDEIVNIEMHQGICTFKRKTIAYNESEYYFIYKPHVFKNSETKYLDSYCRDVSEIETQQLILMSDLCITDYSSIAFDFLAANKESYFLWKDYQLYNSIRGIYEEFKRDFDDVIAYNETDLYTFIRDEKKNNNKIDGYYKLIDFVSNEVSKEE